MIRMSKLTDYGIVLLAELASGDPEVPHNAREIASEVALPFPVVSKILKALAREGLLISHRGAKGGYGLARPAERISVAEIVGALEGPIALMECNEGPGQCAHETRCRLRSPWQQINHAIREALGRVTLAELIRPPPAGPAPIASLSGGLGSLTGRPGGAAVRGARASS